MKIATIIAAAYLLPLLLTQCRPVAKHEIDGSSAPPLQKHPYHQALMGTRFSITLYATDKTSADRAAKEAFQRAAVINDACSDYDVTSELMRLNTAPTHQEIPV